jgi:2-polyprenyl-6-methoxyphenol hydroxylase-like FAD-dependent oxidoreductase
MKAASVRPLVGKTIGIVGGGVGGLALAVGLQERIKQCASALTSSNQSGSEPMTTKVFVYDGADPPSPPGTLLLGLNKGALSSLKQISEKVAKDVQDEGVRIEGINLIDNQGVVLEQIGMNANAATAEVLAIPRDTIRSIFLRHIEDRSMISYRDPIVAVKNVAEKVANSEGTGTAIKNKICVELERNGSQPSKIHDLVVGCDGLNSVVRRHLFARLHDLGIDRQRYLKLFGIAGVAKVSYSFYFTVLLRNKNQMQKRNTKHKSGNEEKR